MHSVNSHITKLRWWWWWWCIRYLSDASRPSASKEPWFQCIPSALYGTSWNWIFPSCFPPPNQRAGWESSSGGVVDVKESRACPKHRRLSGKRIYFCAQKKWKEFLFSFLSISTCGEQRVCQRACAYSTKMSQADQLGHWELLIL